ncbi:ribosomal protection-like ABC-F family protein [Metabacillus litoralis]|uniref:ribosomal protection-like ABC-F family protein n=1 Tax=Metabacillus litoralis TaxID=152268 RepID=UPI001CFC6F56|nr:ABC-F type ribosomal protection protein [Metabacillus litoralis]
MFLLEATSISKQFGDQQVLNKISFHINKYDRIGLVGANGCGKTTLAQILNRKIQPDEGSLNTVDKITISYLSQTIDYKMKNGNHFSSDFLQNSRELGLEKINMWENKRFNSVSEGEKLKIALAKIWSTHPDLIILDEPTNHLDYQGVTWLIDQLKKYKGSVIIISHDRYFLDETVNKIFDIDRCKLTIYNGSYTEFQSQKKKQYDEKVQQYEVQQKYKEKIEGQMNQLQKWSDKAHRTMRDQEGFKEFHGVKAKKLDRAVKSKYKRLERELERNKVEKPMNEDLVHFQFQANKKRGKRIAEARNITKTFPTKDIFTESSFYFNHGERIGLVGPNGSGKTTLLKILLNQESLTSGSMSINDSLRIAYLNQDVTNLPLNQTAIEALAFSEQAKITQARSTLAKMGMKGEKLAQKIETLSLGEVTRIKLTKILLDEYDLLILDEPTNHLDLSSREQLEETLIEFSGTLLIVSHDFYFLNKVCNKLLVIANKKVKRIETNLKDFQEKQNQKYHTNRLIKEELLRITTNLSAIISELSLVSKDSQIYKQLDNEFLTLTNRKQELLNTLKDK